MCVFFLPAKVLDRLITAILRPNFLLVKVEDKSSHFSSVSTTPEKTDCNETELNEEQGTLEFDRGQL